MFSNKFRKLTCPSVGSLDSSKDAHGPATPDLMWGQVHIGVLASGLGDTVVLVYYMVVSKKSIQLVSISPENVGRGTTHMWV